MKKIIALLLCVYSGIINAQEIPADSTSVYCPWLWPQTQNSFPEAEDFGITIGEQFDFTNLVSKDQELISHEMILALSVGRPIVVLIGSGSCPRFRLLAEFLRDFSFDEPIVNIWVNVLEAHPIDTLCPYKENLTAGPFPGNEPYFSFNQIRKYGEFRERSEYVINQMSLPDNWMYFVDEPMSRVLSQVVSPAVLLVLDPRNGEVFFELGHIDSVGLVNALSSLNLSLGIKEQNDCFGVIAPSPITHESHWIGGGSVLITISDLSGQVVMVSDGEVDGTSLVPGIYVAMIKDKKGEIIFQTIVR